MLSMQSVEEWAWLQFVVNQNYTVQTEFRIKTLLFTFQ